MYHLLLHGVFLTASKENCIQTRASPTRSHLPTAGSRLPGPLFVFRLSLLAVSIDALRIPTSNYAVCVLAGGNFLLALDLLSSSHAETRVSAIKLLSLMLVSDAYICIYCRLSLLLYTRYEENLKKTNSSCDVEDFVDVHRECWFWYVLHLQRVAIVGPRGYLCRPCMMGARMYFLMTTVEASCSRRRCRQPAVSTWYGR